MFSLRGIRSADCQSAVSQDAILQDRAQAGWSEQHESLPICNRRYGRLTICATLNGYAFQRWVQQAWGTESRQGRKSFARTIGISFVPDGTQGYWLSNPPMNRWAIFYRPHGLRGTIAVWSLAPWELSEPITMPSSAFRALGVQPRRG